MPEIPKEQKQALEYSVKVPMMDTNVLIRRWTAFQKLDVSRIQAPGMYYASLDPGSKVGMGPFAKVCWIRPRFVELTHTIMFLSPLFQIVIDGNSR